MITDFRSKSHFQSTLSVSLPILMEDLAFLMTLVLEIPDSWRRPLGLDTADPAGRAREMLVIESYREGKISRGQAAEMLGLGFHETEVLLRRYAANQQPTWEEFEQSSQAFKSLIE